MLKITVLTENQEACGLEAEHGLSVYLQYNGRTILLDAGQSGVFARNAQRLGCDLSAVEFAVLSHAHYDHAGGFDVFFEQNQSASVYAAAEGKLLDCWSIGEKQRYIGIPQELLQKYEDRFIWISGLQQLCPGVYLVPHSTPGLEQIGAKTGMYRRYEDEEFRPDDFAHEQSLVIETKQGLAVFNSCSHGGVANIVNEVRAAFPGKKICAYIGGFHLKAPDGSTAQPGDPAEMNCTKEEVEQLGRSLLALGITQIYTGHCTGACGYDILKREMGEVLQPLQTGMSVALN